MPNLEYLEIDSYSNGPVVKVTNFDAFLKLLNEFETKRILLYKKTLEDGATITQFIAYHDGLMYAKEAYGYKTLQDYLDGGKKSYAGSSGKYAIEESAVKSTKEQPRRSSSDGDIYYYINGCGFKDFAEFDDAFEKGFVADWRDEERGQPDSRPTPVVYRDAMNRKLADFSSYSRYKSFVKRTKEAGFDSEEDYKLAMKVGLPRADLYRDYLALQMTRSEFHLKTSQEAHLLLIVANVKPSTSETLENLILSLEKGYPQSAPYDEDLENFGPSHFNSVYPPEWYSKGFQYVDDVEQFLSSSPAVGTLGTYDTKAKKFSRNTVASPGKDLLPKFFQSAEKENRMKRVFIPMRPET